MRSLKKRGPHVLDDLMTSYFPYKCSSVARSSIVPARLSCPCVSCHVINTTLGCTVVGLPALIESPVKRVNVRIHLPLL